MTQIVKTKSQQITTTTKGGQVLSWEIDNKPMLYRGSSIKRSGIPLLFPYANPLKNDIFVKTGKAIPQHGFVRNLDWKTLNLSESSITYYLTNNDLSEEMQEAYPFEFRLELTYDISNANELNYLLKISNLSDNEIPIAPGLHPYFPITHLEKTNLKISNINFEAKKMGWDNKLNGDFFEFKDKTSIVDFGNWQIEIDTNDSEIDFNYLVVWSQNQSYPDHDFVCVEPFTKETDAINKNPILIQPNQSKNIDIKFKYQTK